MNSELKPCPWCGTGPSDDERATQVQFYRELNAQSGYVWCECCGGQGPTRGTRVDAVAAWNTRADPIPTDDSELLTIAWMDGSHRSTKAHRDTIAALQAEVERLREALRYYADEDNDYPNEGPWGVNSTDFGFHARTTLEARND